MQTSPGSGGRGQPCGGGAPALSPLRNAPELDPRLVLAATIPPATAVPLR